MAIHVASEAEPSAFSLTNVELVVLPTAFTTVTTDPTVVYGGRKAVFGLIVANSGNAPVTAMGFAIDPEDLAKFTLDPPAVLVPPGGEQVIQIRAKGGRHWFGQARGRTFTFGVDAEDRIETIGTFIQRPRIGRGLISLLGLLTAAAIFALVLRSTFDQVIEDAEVPVDVLEEALGPDEAGGAFLPSRPGSLSGKLVTATTGAGLAGVQGELFRADDTSEPVATSVSNANGEFAFSNLGEGDYKLRLSGAGVDPVWYPDGRVADEGQPITVVLGESTTLGEPVAVGGLPVEVSGRVAADDPLDLSGATVSLIAVGQLDPDGEALVGDIPIAVDGSFRIPDVPSPGTYTIVLEKPGFATDRRTIDLAAGDDLSGLDLVLRSDIGIITGRVNDSTSPIGGATIVATTSTAEFTTVSLTDGDVGSFTLRNLPVPGQYTVTISAPGFAPETQTVTLDETDVDDELQARLIESIGSISGTVSLGGIVQEGLLVSISGPDVARTTPVASQGAQAGTYRFGALPVPGTYTLTFTGADAVEQVRVIDIDPPLTAPDIPNVGVVLSPGITDLTGLVRDPAGNPVSQATVELTNGANTFTYLSADEPAGQFRFVDIPAGVYTLTASRVGTDPEVRLVNISPGEPLPDQVLDLKARASLVGQIRGIPAGSTVTVKLFEPTQFPRGTTVATTQTTGTYRFDSLDAPKAFVVAVFAGPDTADPLVSVVVETSLSTEETVPTLSIGAVPQ